MPKIANIRCLLLSSPYADADDPEIKECFPNGPKRTIGMVEVTLDNGVTGLGEGYLAVFAPKVFQSIVELCAPQVMGKDGFDIAARVRDLRSLCDYWSLQGAARHVIAAFEIALWDAKGKSLGKPVYDLLSDGPKADAIRIYGSGGCCDRKEQFLRELDLLESLGITIFKMRSVKHDILRTAWVLEEAGAARHRGRRRHVPEPRASAAGCGGGWASSRPSMRRPISVWFSSRRRSAQMRPKGSGNCVPASTCRSAAARSSPRPRR
ncbi:MAG: hypothetical protein R3D84_08335 [Paracoccaceae bacterium]